MFKSVSSRVSFPELDTQVLKQWQERDVFRRTESERKDAPLFMMYEGPPTANGSPGIHHVLARVFKDVICRYQTMKGFRVERKGGWDTHGLPVELEIEKELGLSSKRDIEEYGIEEFNKKCRESVFRYVKEWEEMTDRIGFWVDMDDPYVTLENDYIETGWWMLKTLWDRDLLYQDLRGTPHCPRCVTSLSSHEVALGYRENTPDPSVFVKFRVTGIPPTPLYERGAQNDLSEAGATSDTAASTDGNSGGPISPPIEGGRPISPPFGKGGVGGIFDPSVPTYLLAWTTTPWTLPGNTGLAVDNGAEYSVIEIEEEGGRQRLVLATALLAANLRQEYSVVGTVQGADLVGLGYEPLYQPEEFGSEVRRFARRPGPGGVMVSEMEPASGFAPKVVAADFVSLDDGTGVVHIAPAFGDEDLGVGREQELFFVQPVDLQGVITGNYPFAGKFVKDADPDIMDELSSRGLLFHRDIYRHTYPFCWRCDTPLLYYAKSSWYIRTSALKDQLVGGNSTINWYPDYIKEGRFGEWLRNNVDWAISRERYWGTPIPIWQCQDCQHTVCVGSIEELKSLAQPGSMASANGNGLDLHRPYVDNVVLSCTSDGCSGEMRRIPEVMDAWFDSGAMPFAQLHYPFENEDMEQRGRYPADYICEAVDQTRGWFYSLHALGTLLKGQPSYKNVICLGLVLDEKGRKMSKRVGNVVQPMPVLEEHGADALRWYLFTASHPGEPRRFSAKLVSETLRRVMLTLWNVYSFFTSYAEIDKFHPDQKPDGWNPENELDRWVMSELQTLIAQTGENMENYDPTNAGRRIQEFIDNLSNWYVRRSRRRFWRNEGDADKLSGYLTLHTCLVELSKLMAPLAPFVAEEIYQNLVCGVDPSAPDSVHLARYPEADQSLIDEPLMEATQLAMRVASMGRAARSKAGIKVRQPLNSINVLVRDDIEKHHFEPVASQLVEELNIKKVVISVARGPDDYAFWEWDISPDMSKIGPKYGSDASRISESLASSDPRNVYLSNILNGWTEISVPGSKASPIHLEPEDVIITKTAKEHGYVVIQDGPYAVAVETTISPELHEEGLARELVHKIQGMRRSANFDVTDRIVTFYEGPDEFDRLMQGAFSNYIQEETLSERLVDGPPEEGASSDTAKIEGMEVTLGVLRA